jgi:hypothetical protein
MLELALRTSLCVQMGKTREYTYIATMKKTIVTRPFKSSE